MAVNDEVCGSAGRQGRVAFVELYTQWPAYFLDSFMAIQAEDLREAGHSVAWFKGFLLDEAHTQLSVLEDELARSGPWDFLVFERLWSREILQRLKEAAGHPRVVVTPWEPPGDWSEVDYRIAPPARGVLTQLIEQDLSGMKPKGTNLHVRESEGAWLLPEHNKSLEIREYFQLPVDFAYDLMRSLGLPKKEVSQTRYLMLNMGCPYRNATNTSGFLDALELPTSWGASGCTFCNVGPYEAQTQSQRFELIHSQLKALSKHEDYTRLVVVDEFVFRDIATLAEAILSHAPQGVEVLVRARVNYLETYLPALLKALETLQGHGSITPYLVGFENFSDAELKRYNKGQSAAETLSAARTLIKLSEEWDNLNLSPSQGFILFGPWTSLEDLRLNAKALASTDFRALRGGITRTKLRLNPDAALVARARADGLLIESHLRPDEDNAASTGYQAEIPYRFKDPRTEQVWTLLNGPKPIQASSELARLEAAIAEVERHN